MKAHKLSEIFPRMTDSELEGLAEDIKTNGLQEKIITYQEKILDGNNREAACRIANVTPQYKEYKGKDPLGYVISANWRRRHMTESQRALVAARLADMKQGERTDLEPSATLPKVSQAQAAAALNVSPRSVSDAKKVLEEAPKSEVKKVERGEKSVSTVAKEIREKEHEEEKADDPLGTAAQDFCTRINQYTRQIDAWKNEFDELKRDPLAHNVHFDSAQAQLVAVRKALHQGRPNSRCPYCKATGRKGREKCGTCKGTGYVSRSIYVAGCKAVGTPPEPEGDE